MPYSFTEITKRLSPEPKQYYRENFAEWLSDEFKNSHDWFTVQEETSTGSEEYQNVEVRINYVISNETGEKMSDDYKLLYFKDLDHVVNLGAMFYFDNNYWVCINTEKVKSLTNTVTVKRCNEILRWVDGYGGYYSVPCSMADPLIRENRDYSTTGSAVVNISGVIEIMAQFNEKTNTIKANQRFLFGNPSNWTCYKVAGAGVNNLNRMKTEDPYSVGLVRFSMMGNQYNENTDDLVNGVCDYYQNEYTISLNTGDLSLNIGQQMQLVATAFINDKSTVREFTWTSSDESVFEVDSGLVNPKREGFATLRVYLKNNEEVYEEITISVVSVPVVNSYIQVYPNKNYLLETTSETFQVYLYKNGIQQSDGFTFSVTSSEVPQGNYTLTTLSPNSFLLENIEKYLDAPLVVTCTSGSNVLEYSILLKGGW